MNHTNNLSLSLHTLDIAAHQSRGSVDSARAAALKQLARRIKQAFAKTLAGRASAPNADRQLASC